MEQPAQIIPFNTRAYPNPTSEYFTLRVESENTETVNVRVFDINGKQVYVTSGSANQSYRFGQNFINGIYLVEVRQGDKRSMIKLLKH